MVFLTEESRLEEFVRDKLSQRGTSHPTSLCELNINRPCSLGTAKIQPRSHTILVGIHFAR